MLESFWKNIDAETCSDIEFQVGGTIKSSRYKLVYMFVYYISGRNALAHIFLSTYFISELESIKHGGKNMYLLVLFVLRNLASCWWNLLSGKIKLLHADILVCSCSAPNTMHISHTSTISMVLIFLRLFRIVVQMEIVFSRGSPNTCRDCFYIVPYSFFPFSDFTQMHCLSSVHRSHPAQHNEGLHTWVH